MPAAHSRTQAMHEEGQKLATAALRTVSLVDFYWQAQGSAAEVYYLSC